VFIDAIVTVKVRDGQATNRPVYAAVGVTIDGYMDVLRLWTGTGGQGVKFWTVSWSIGKTAVFVTYFSSSAMA
jgi:transposase-like protein